ncbi:MAG: hypothetical protein RLY45_447 [Actinomycetota bacterium]
MVHVPYAGVMSDSTPPSPPAAPGSPADWYPDPTGRHEYRYFDGTAWTDHVSKGGVQSTDPLGAPRLDRFENILTVGNEGARVAEQVSGTGMRGAGIEGTAFGGGGTLFTEPVLVVNQKAKLIELRNQYSVFNKDGAQVAVVNQVGQGALRKIIRLFTQWDQFLTHRLEVTDTQGRVLLRLVRPAKVFKSRVVVSGADGGELGQIVQQNVFGKIRFDLVAGGTVVGSIKAENWRAWNFRIEDAAGTEVARITKTWEGALKTLFTTADNYVVQIHRVLPQPLNSLVVASALSIDTALKQDDRSVF